MPDSTPTAPQISPPLIDRCIVVAGATASGKSSLGMRLCERLNGEILSLDSIALYRDMDIGTAKPTGEDQRRVPHHLLDLAEPNEDYSVACYLTEAERCVESIRARGKMPIFVGGTPLYLKAILRGFDPGPPPDWEFREAAERDLEKHGIEALIKRLWQVDPLSASKIDAGDSRRMIRALEVAKTTGVPLSHRQVQFDHSVLPDACAVFALRHERSVLHARISQRVQRMFADGLVDEIRELLAKYGTLSRTAGQAVGYREIISWLGSSEPLSDVMEQVTIHTRQLAKRQETWFRSFDEITVIDVADPVDEDAVLQRMVQQVERCSL